MNIQNKMAGANMWNVDQKNAINPGVDSDHDESSPEKSSPTKNT